MAAFAGASRAAAGRRRIEGPTWLALAGCYSLWVLLLYAAPALGIWAAIPGAIVVAFHSSLQHEVSHGHPTRSAVLNEALVFPALGLFIPYRRFRDLHLRHHNDSRLTDPYDDPESFYVPVGDWRGASRPVRWLLAVNGTFAGRLVVGPALALWGFWRSEFRRLRAGNVAVRGAWLRHVLGLVPVALTVWASGMSLWLYVFGIAYPAMSLIMVRSYIEHRAAHSAPERTAVVEAHWFWRLLFLNNNYHAVHHLHPAMPWYLLRARWIDDKENVLARNGGYYVGGYGEVWRRWLFARREPVVHPFTGHDAVGGSHPADPRQDQRRRSAAGQSSKRQSAARRGAGAA